MEIITIQMLGLTGSVLATAEIKGRQSSKILETFVKLALTGFQGHSRFSIAQSGIVPGKAGEVIHIRKGDLSPARIDSLEQNIRQIVFKEKRAIFIQPTD